MRLESKKSPRCIGQVLLQTGSITKDQLEAAFDHLKRTGNRITQSLVELGYISESGLKNTVSAALNIPNLSLVGVEINPAILRLVPYDLASKCGVIPIFLSNNVLTVVTDDPCNGIAVDKIASHTKKQIKTAMASFSDIQTLLKKYHPATAANSWPQSRILA